MNIPAIRAALERLSKSTDAFTHCGTDNPIVSAVVVVGLRACDEATHDICDGVGCPICDASCERVRVIADILREAGVEVGE